MRRRPKPSIRQLGILKRVELGGGSIGAQALSELGEQRTILALFRDGWLTGDSIPVKTATLTQDARNLLACL